ncbi:MAG: internal scaffolding protein [Microviridae sp.]|nr:MAG: internal scaffolding protein [Microviridae sp.]
MRNVRPYGYRARVPFYPVGESMTEQSHAGLCDINNIVARFQSTGQLPPPRVEGQYADVTRLQMSLQDRINWSTEVILEHAASLDEAPPPGTAVPDPAPPAPLPVDPAP